MSVSVTGYGNGGTAGRSEAGSDFSWAEKDMSALARLEESADDMYQARQPTTKSSVLCDGARSCSDGLRWWPPYLEVVRFPHASGRADVGRRAEEEGREKGSTRTALWRSDAGVSVMACVETCSR